MFLIQDLISRVIVNDNGISVNQNVSLDVDNQKQIEFLKFKMFLFNGHLNTLRFFFTHPVLDFYFWNGLLFVFRL